MSRPLSSLLCCLPLALAVTLAGSLAAPPAHADLSRKVIAAFKGKILVTQAPLESVGDDKATIAHFKKVNLATLKGEQNGNDAGTGASSPAGSLPRPTAGRRC